MHIINTENYSAVSAKELGSAIPELFMQVGVISTHYARKDIDTDELIEMGHLNEAVLRNNAGRYFAVEVVKELAIMQEVKDPEVLTLIEDFIKEHGIPDCEGNPEAEIFQLEQTLVLNQEVLGESGADA